MEGEADFAALLCCVCLAPHGMLDPAYIAHASPILAWARLIWLNRMPCDELSLVSNWAAERSAEHAEPWRYITGPGQAYVHTVTRLGWAPISGAELLLDDGRILDMRGVPPAILADEIRSGVERWSWRKTAVTLDSPQLATGDRSRGSNDSLHLAAS